VTKVVSTTFIRRDTFGFAGHLWPRLNSEILFREAYKNGSLQGLPNAEAHNEGLHKPGLPHDAQAREVTQGENNMERVMKPTTPHEKLAYALRDSGLWADDDDVQLLDAIRALCDFAYGHGQTDQRVDAVIAALYRAMK
jgi:hypothetical protein